MNPRRFLHTIMLPILGIAATAVTALAMSPSPSRSHEPFGMVDGKPVTLYTLKNSKGMEAKITNYGGIVVALKVADKKGKFGDVVLGYDSVAAYVRATPYFGALIGRYGNRIGNASFAIEGKTYTPPKNDGVNTLHGGVKGFDKVVWTAAEPAAADDASLTLTYVSRDGEEGFPGTLTTTVVYSITENNELSISYSATTDKPTVVALTHHSYFNLAGDGNGNILDHVLTLNADKFLPVDNGLIPTGVLQEVKGTPMDFLTPHAIGERIKADFGQLKFGPGGYDHAWVLNRKEKEGKELEFAARASEESSGRVMEVYTTEPAIQFYSGNFLDGTLKGKTGRPYEFRTGFCLETEHYPDSPNKPAFPTTLLRPGQTLSSKTVYRFSTK
jgi:aldose 1-epimerase